jgi:hypothetical protein
VFKLGKGTDLDLCIMYMELGALDGRDRRNKDELCQASPHLKDGM